MHLGPLMVRREIMCVSKVSKDILKNNLVGRLLRDGQLETAAAHSRGEADPRQKPMSTTSPGDVTWF